MSAVTTTIADRLAHAGHSFLAWSDDHAINIIVILIVAWVVRRFGTKLISKVLAHTVRSDLYPTKSDRDKRVKTLRSLTHAVMRVSVYLVAVTLILGEINPGYATALFASAGLVTVALSFGAKNLIGDFISGIFIIYENQYRVGDVIELSCVGAASATGTVEDITIRTTVLRDDDGNVHHIPNGNILVTTNTTMGYSKLNENLAVGVETDLGLLERVINHVGEAIAAKPELNRKIKEAPHFAGVTGIGDGGIAINITGITSASEKLAVRNELYRQLMPALRSHDIIVANAQPIVLPSKD